MGRLLGVWTVASLSEVLAKLGELPEFMQGKGAGGALVHRCRRFRAVRQTPARRLASSLRSLAVSRACQRCTDRAAAGLSSPPSARRAAGAECLDQQRHGKRAGQGRGRLPGGVGSSAARPTAGRGGSGCDGGARFGKRKRAHSGRRRRRARGRAHGYAVRGGRGGPCRAVDAGAPAALSVRRQLLPHGESGE